MKSERIRTGKRWKGVQSSMNDTLIDRYQCNIEHFNDVKSPKHPYAYVDCGITNGCFDVLHVGHLQLLKQFYTECHVRHLTPVIALNSDISIKKIKGESRPIVPERSRAALLASLSYSFYVILFDEETPQELMDFLKPRIVVKGSEYAEKDVIKWSGSETVFVDTFEDWSTTNILEKKIEKNSCNR